MESIALQVESTTMAISIPNKDTLSELRKAFSLWLTIFSEARYDDFEFFDNFQPVYQRFSQRFVWFISRVFPHMILGAFLVGALLIMTYQFWADLPFQLLESVGFLIRFVILIILSFGIYERFHGVNLEDSDSNKWRRAVRLLLFFFVPFIAIDKILQTGIIDTVVEIIKSIKIF